MFLKSLELFGFKSFADKTEIVFERGLTAIVGPNGCGKSNIVDAIRWALGEQSARSLRGGAMTDVIFNGGGRRGPINMAEVTLAFDNGDRTLAIERDEVRVTRRLYRSGESEYLLNGRPARLRDIRELLLDTGAGASAATFVEQGKIDALLHASAEERRHVLEEAAGIGKYKIRKKECLDRLAEVSTDRRRLADLLAEVIQRHEDVKRQAEKAGKYVQVRDRLKTLRLELARHKRSSLERRIASAGSRIEKSRAEASAEGTRAARLSEDASALAESRRSRESAQRNAELEIRDLAAAIDGRKRQAEQEAKRGSELAEERARVERSLADAEKRTHVLEREVEAGKKAAAEMREKDAGLSGQMEALESRAAELEKAAAAAAAEVDLLKRDLLARMQEEAKARNRLGELDARSKVLAGREDRLTRKQMEVASALADREAEIETLAQRAAEAEARAGALERDLGSANGRRDGAETTLRRAEEGFLDARKRHGEVEARLQALRSLESEGEGLEPGVRALLETNNPGIIGPLADLIKVDRAHATAIEAALGARAQWVACRSQPEAVELARWLTKSNRGRACVVSADSSGCCAKDEPAPPTHEGFVGWATALVGSHGGVNAIVRRILDRTAVVRDLDTALSIVHAREIERCVTLAGEIVGADGAIEAGLRTGVGRVERIAERTELETSFAWGEAELQARRIELERLRDAERAAAKEVERIRAEHNEARLQAFSSRKEREERERGVARVREEARLCASELAEITADLKDAVEGLAEVEKDVLRYREAAAALEERASDRALAARAVEIDRAAAREELNDLKIRVARGAARFESIRQAAARAERELAEVAKLQATLNMDLAQAAARQDDSRQMGERLRSEADAMVRERSERESRYKAAQIELEALIQRLAELRAAEAEASTAQTRAEATLAAAERESREATVRLDELASRMREELSIEIATLELPAEPRPGDPPFSEVAAEREAGTLRRQIEEIGPVNLEALEECERLAERRKFLAEQTRDLEGAEENLRTAVRKINETSRKRFLETFEAVRENFQLTFRKLFGGGKADLALEEGKDVLEAGVEVTARPPGKEARTLTLLSGGEKVLTTVALLFAVFRAKPGPFCILDEVDAALDEHNVGRFVTLVREFLDRSQFLIVTHNKRTMKAADALYGVTMPEQGVSAPVSVRLGRIEDDPGAALVGSVASGHADRPIAATA